MVDEPETGGASEDHQTGPEPGHSSAPSRQAIEEVDRPSANDPAAQPDAHPPAFSSESLTTPSDTVPADQSSPANTAQEPEDQQEGEEEEEGGPVMSFLEHLEALRWTLIKSATAVLIAMVLCLVAANKLVGILVWPLERAQQDLLRREKVAVFQVGDTVLWKLRGEEAAAWPGLLGTNQSVFYNLVPRLIGSNYVWVIEPESDPAARASVSTISLKNYTPLGPFTVALQLALYGGLGLSSPFVLYFLGQFVVPAMRRSERRLLFPALGLGTVLFLLGVAFCYLIMVQIALNAAVLFSRWMSFGADEWRAEEYVSFVCKFMLGMGLAFELPVVILTLVKIELLDYRRLTRFRPYWIVINLVISAVLTPPDPVSMLLMALPLQVLFEISVLVARFWARRTATGG